LTDEQLEELRTKTVEVLLALRASYLREYGASVALKHWEQLETRMLSSTRRAGNPDEWVTLMQRGLRLQSTSKALSLALIDLGASVREAAAQQQWLDMIEREAGLMIAMTRMAAEKRQEENTK